MTQPSTTALYPGTFDPITLGHIDIIERASKLSQTLIIAVANSPTKQPKFSLEQRVKLIEASCAHLSNIKVIGFSGLLAQLAKQHGANVLIRGVRNSIDFEYELQLAHVNRELNHELETILLTPRKELSHISSTIVKEVYLHGGSVENMVPTVVIDALSSDQ